jgi:hypothetical protein
MKKRISSENTGQLEPQQLRVQPIAPTTSTYEKTRIDFLLDDCITDDESSQDQENNKNKENIPLESNTQNEINLLQKNWDIINSNMNNNLAEPIQKLSLPQPQIPNTSKDNPSTEIEMDLETDHDTNMETEVQADELLKVPNEEIDKQIVSKLSSDAICQDIYKLKMLTDLTFLVPYKSSECFSDYNTVHFIPYFKSLKYLAVEAARVEHMKCKVIAKLFRNSISAPSIASVFVHCDKCNYINFTPFHFANIHHPAILTTILVCNNLEQFSEDENTQVDDEQNRRIKEAVNFSVSWLKRALPVDIQMPQDSQSQAIQYNGREVRIDNDKSNNVIPIMYYQCPRCFLNLAATNDFSSQMQPSQYISCQNTLNYIYRFWFVLRDGDGILDKCLLEGELAEKFASQIRPADFFTDQRKATKARKIINEKIDQKFLFTIETYKLLNDDGNKNNKDLNVLYKITEIDLLN